MCSVGFWGRVVLLSGEGLEKKRGGESGGGLLLATLGER